MRILGVQLLADQKSMGDAKAKLFLATQGNVAAETYYIDSGTDIIRKITHTEQEWSHTLQIVIQDSSHTVADLDRHGYKGFLSWGYGSNYSTAAPLEVVTQRTDSARMITTYGLAGVFDMMNSEHSRGHYSPDDANGDTVKDILTWIAEATFTKTFFNAKAYTITFDSGYDAGDDLANTVIPADYFGIAVGESRLSAFKKALDFTNLKARIEADGEIHIFAPTTTGSTYDYEYNDLVTEHNFFDKSVRKRLVIPNKVIVSSHPDHETRYSGTATDSASFASLGRYMDAAPVFIRALSNAQCLSIAEARIANLQLAAERGSGFVPMNCGQEVADYVKITDSRVGDTRVGNVGYLVRNYEATGKPTDFSMRFGFGKLAVGGIGATVQGGEGFASFDYVNESILNLARWFLDLREVIPKLHIEKQAIMPVWIPGTPTLTTHAVSNIGSSTATGNGTIVDLGIPDPTAYGVCWSITPSPRTSDSTTNEGATSITGAFNTAMTNLTTSTLYYVRAYATNSMGTSYGIQVIFTTT